MDKEGNGSGSIETTNILEKPQEKNKRKRRRDRGRKWKSSPFELKASRRAKRFKGWVKNFAFRMVDKKDKHLLVSVSEHLNRLEAIPASLVAEIKKVFSKLGKPKLAKRKINNEFFSMLRSYSDSILQLKPA